MNRLWRTGPPDLTTSSGCQKEASASQLSSIWGPPAPINRAEPTGQGSPDLQTLGPSQGVGRDAKAQPQMLPPKSHEQVGHVLTPEIQRQRDPLQAAGPLKALLPSYLSQPGPQTPWAALPSACMPSTLQDASPIAPLSSLQSWFQSRQQHQG